MQLKVLGSAAGIGWPARTTSFLIDDDTLLDCGSGVGELTVEELLCIRRVLLTHSHLDHCNALPLLADVHASHGGPGIVVYSQQETIDALKAHLFNGVLWPDYTVRPSAAQPWVRCIAMEVGDALPLAGGLATVLPAQHSIPAIGWLLEGRERALAFSGDSGPCTAFWQWIAQVPSLSDVICEVTYPNEQAQEAADYGHMAPAWLLPLRQELPPQVQLWASHLDSAARDSILTQLQADDPVALPIRPLEQGMVIEL